jgi:hypothetical protein
MILVSQTYEIITPESAENGEAEETGFVYEDSEFTFSELVAKMREHPAPSCSGAVDCRTWFTAYGEHERDGSYENTSIHFSRENPRRNEKYWRWAAAIAASRASRRIHP